MEFSNLSRYRTQLMGLSILMIMVFHSYLGMNTNYMLIEIATFDIAVDFFAILSGLGVYFSFEKNDSIRLFYKKRLLRILPATLVTTTFVVLWQWRCTEIHSVWSMLADITTFSTFLGKNHYWFITYIIICYLIAPFAYRIIKRVCYRRLIMATLLLIILMFSYLFLPLLNPAGAMIYMRLPSFFIGLIVGYCIRSNIRINAILTIISSIIGVSILFFMRYYELTETYVRLGYFFFSLPILLVLTYCHYILEFLRIDRFLVFVGAITLEIYLLHENIILLYVKTHISNYSIVVILSIVTSIIAAKFLNIIINNTIKLLNTK